MKNFRTLASISCIFFFLSSPLSFAMGIEKGKEEIIEKMLAEIAGLELETQIKEELRTIIKGQQNVWQAAKDGGTVGAFAISALGYSLWQTKKSEGSVDNAIRHAAGMIAAITLLPFNLITAIPGIPIGAGIGAGSAMIENISLRDQMATARENALEYFRWMHRQVLEKQLSFNELPLAERLQELSTYVKNTRQKIISQESAQVKNLIQYSDSPEDRMKADVITALLRTKTFQLSDRTMLQDEELNNFMTHFPCPDNFSQNTNKESVLLALRIGHLFLQEAALRYNLVGVNLADIVRKILAY